MSNKILSSWKISPMYPVSEIREGISKKPIIYLSPENYGENKTWIWFVCNSNFIFGRHKDKEVAREEADKKLIEMGYEIK